MIRDLQEVKGLFQRLDNQIKDQQEQLALAEPRLIQDDQVLDESNERIQYIYDRSWRFCSLL